MLEDATMWSPVEQREEICRLTGGRQHCRRSAFERADLCRYHIAGRILQARVEVALRLQIKQLPHCLAGVIFERGRLDDRNLPRLPRARGVARLNTVGLDVLLKFAHGCLLLSTLSFVLRKVRQNFLHGRKQPVCTRFQQRLFRAVAPGRARGKKTHPAGKRHVRVAVSEIKYLFGSAG